MHFLLRTRRTPSKEGLEFTCIEKLNVAISRCLHCSGCLVQLNTSWKTYCFLLMSGKGILKEKECKKILLYTSKKKRKKKKFLQEKKGTVNNPDVWNLGFSLAYLNDYRTGMTQILQGKFWMWRTRFFTLMRCVRSEPMNQVVICP